MPLASVTRFSWRHLDQWQIALVPTLLIVGAGLAYFVAARGVPGWPRSRRIFFTAGLVVTFLATESVVAVYDNAYFSDHMIQHLMLVMVAAVLFALSAPLDLAYAAGGPSLRAILDGRVMALVTHPLVAFGAYFGFIPVTHLTSLFNLLLEHEWLHDLEHLAFLVVGYLFFRAALGIERGRALHPGLRLVYVMAAVPVDTVTGLALAMSSHNPFSHYRVTAPAGSSSAWILSNVRLGGAIMWIGGDALMLLACIPIAIAWVRWETARTRELDARLDAQGL
ncbi:MAG: cytochrome c oxidase assembly protein [Acidobacteriota bacterium]|nr:cytochrome c oxidase assembly protein [Acidobacteriota bacterium]